MQGGAGAVAATLLLAAAAAAPAAPCDGYARELATMAGIDQALRARWDLSALPAASAGPPRIVQQTLLADRIHTRRLKTLAATCGWPRRSRDGAAAVDDAWLLAQHADQDPVFQRAVLGHLQRAVAAGEAPAGHLAYLSDRVDTAAGRPQRYGTQLRMTGPCALEFMPLDDAGRVDARRRAIGMPPLSEYLRRVLEEQRCPTP